MIDIIAPDIRNLDILEKFKGNLAILLDNLKNYLEELPSFL